MTAETLNIFLGAPRIIGLYERLGSKLARTNVGHFNQRGIAALGEISCAL